jgi:hypothetical protein
MVETGGGSAVISSVPANLRTCGESVGAWSTLVRIRVGGLLSAVALSPQRQEMIRLATEMRSCSDGHDRLADELNRVAQAFADADSNPAPAAIAVAVGEEGYREKGTNRTKFGAWFGANGEAWCAMFVSWSFAQAETPLPGITSSKGFSAVRSGWAYAKSHDRLVWKPQPGDIFLIRTSGRKGHTGIVVSVDEQSGLVHTIEGNTNTKGSREGTTVLQKTRAISSINHGFWRPFGDIAASDRNAPNGAQITWPTSVPRSGARKNRKKPTKVRR